MSDWLARAWMRVRAIDARRPEALDAVIALGLCVAAVTAGALGQGEREADATFFLLVGIGSVPYVFRRRAPLMVLTLASVPVLALIGLGYSSPVIGSALFLAAYTVAALTGPRVVAVAAGWVVVLLAAVAIAKPGAMPPAEFLTNAALFVGAFGLGRSIHGQRAASALLRERADLAIAARNEAARRAVTEERLRIAQELHDVIGHSLSVIALQAQVGAHVIDTDPAEAKASLVAVSGTSRTALAEIRRVLGALHDADEVYSPAPTLREVEALAAELTDAGLAVEAVTLGTPVDVPAALEMTAYRVIQEALTNVVKHARTAHATVTVRHEPGVVTLEIVDDGPSEGGAVAADTPRDGGAPTGHGLLGMRERVAVWGGTLDAGPTDQGGYAVRARLPFGVAR